jgi:AhpD family alkylhydroperoxidase
MSDFQVYTIESAPQDSKPALEALKAAFGFIPNVAGAMALSPVTMSGFVGLFRNIHDGNFSEAQIQTVLLTNAVTNKCTWAVAFHSFLARKEGLSEEDVAAIRKGGAPKDRKLAALSVLARTLIENRGRIGHGDVQQFLGAGYEKEHVLEVIGVVAASTIANYVGSVAHPPLEDDFRPYAWSV